MATPSTTLRRPTEARRPGSIEAEFIPGEPPPRIIRLITWLLILIVITAAVVACLVQVPETVRSPFILVSEHGADPIQAPVLAVVQKVAVNEGDEVEAGATLFALRSDEIRNWQTQLQVGREDLRALRERGRKLEESHASLLTIKAAELSQVEQQLEFRKKHTGFSRDYLRRMETLAQDGLISEVELIKCRLDLAESEKDENVTERVRQQVMLDRQRLEADRARERSEEQAEESNLKVRIEALQRQLESSEGDLLYVRAPYPAVVISLSQRNPGSVVAAGGTLCELSPLEGRPRARLLLPEEAMSQVNVRQPVRLFVQAFPYQRHGTVAGQLEWVSPAAVATPAGSHFVALASLAQTNLLTRSQWRPLRVGMRGEARISVGRRTLIEYAFEPLRRVREDLAR